MTVEHDGHEISATIRLPASLWDRLTENDKGLDREASDNPAMPDMPLSERIDLFLQVEIAQWWKRVPDYPANTDLDDGIPF